MAETPSRTWQTYEVEKQHWISTNPDATPDEYEAAIRDIIDRLST